MLGNLFRACLGVVILPVVVVADIVTLPSLVDGKKSITIKTIKAIASNLDEI